MSNSNKNKNFTEAKSVEVSENVLTEETSVSVENTKSDDVASKPKDDDINSKANKSTVKTESMESPRAEEAVTAKSIKIGSIVTVKENALSATGSILPAYVYGKAFTVKKILNDRVIITSGPALSHEIAVKENDIVLVR